ncbi:MAG: hypothetical protein O4859_03925 [Trichodesmium sp. St18_bin1]|nr:hypothetical protein [Trichodesmium sp. St18_bin1]
MSENQQEICPMCQVKIVEVDQALFFLDHPILDPTYGLVSANYAQKQGYINQDLDVIGRMKPEDYYRYDIS